MKWGPLLVIAGLACHPKPPVVPVPPPAMSLGGHELVGCRETVRLPTDPVLRRHAGQQPLVHVGVAFGCLDLMIDCRRSYAFALFEDGLFVHEGSACGRAAMRVVRQLDGTAMAAARARMSACAQLDGSGRRCTHGDAVTVVCQTPAGPVRIRDTCGEPENALVRFAEELRSALQVEAIVNEPGACASGAGLSPLLAAPEDLDLTLSPVRTTDCTYRPR